MSSRTKYIIIGVLLVLVLVVLFFPRSGSQPPTNLKPVSKVNQTPKIESQIPNVPQNISLENITKKTLPKTVSTYKISGQVLVPLTFAQVQTIAKNFGFSSAGEKRSTSGGGRSYIFEDSAGRVLSITDDPPSVDYSELPKKSAGKNPPTLEEAKTLSLNLINNIQFTLSTGWEIKSINAVYLKGGESSAGEVKTVEEANLTSVSLGYYYNGYPVLSGKGRQIFMTFAFGPAGSVVSAKVQFLLNNLGLGVEKSGEVVAKNLEEINASFYNGEAQAVSLGLAGTVSDEPIINPPASVSVSDLQNVLVLSGSQLLPYYLISSQGVLPSGRAGEVEYLVPSLNNLK